MALTTLRILGKRGRVTVPQKIREIIGIQKGDIVSFTVTGPDSVSLRRERLCDHCAGPIGVRLDRPVSLRETDCNPVEVIKLARKYAGNGGIAAELLDSISTLPPAQQFDAIAQILANWADDVSE